MRRKKGSLLPLEIAILRATAGAGSAGDGWIHGFRLAKALSADGGRLTAHGTLYKALGRLTAAGLLDDRWEDADVALAQGRPRRRLYQINGRGLIALAEAEAEARAATAAQARVAAAEAGHQPGLAPA